MPEPSYKIVWDGAGEKYYESGVDHGVLYVQNAQGAYPKGVAWNGLTAVTESPSGAEPNDMYADNIKYASLRSAETFGATIEAYTYPDEFGACDGTAEVADGAIIGQQERTPFGFAYRTNIGHDGAGSYFKLHLVWNATASPSEKAYQTINDSPDAITFSWEIETTPVNVSGYKPTSNMVIDSRYADEDNLATLMQTLYGTPAGTDTEAVEGYLPTPDAVIAILNATT